MPRVAPTVALIPAPRPLFITDQLCEVCGDGGADDSQVVCENGDPAEHTGCVCQPATDSHSCLHPYGDWLGAPQHPQS